jgi:hypothetical protein
MATSYYKILQRGHCCCCCCPGAGGTAGRGRPGMGPAAAPAPPAAASAARPAWALASASSRWKKTKIYIISQYSEISKISNVPELHKVCSFQSFKCNCKGWFPSFPPHLHVHVMYNARGGGGQGTSHIWNPGDGVGGGGEGCRLLCFLSCPDLTSGAWQKIN